MTKRKKTTKKRLPIAESICPGCGKPVDDHKCRFCGAVRTVNQVSGNVIWMRNGRVVAAFHDEKEAWSRMAEKWGITREKWPDRFKE